MWRKIAIKALLGQILLAASMFALCEPTKALGQEGNSEQPVEQKSKAYETDSDISILVDGCPGEGDCCKDSNSPGCEDESCCNAVCAEDPYCCDPNGVWDDVCAELAWSLCSELSCVEGACPGQENCCEPNHSPGCEDESCCSIICTNDPYCCITAWDGNCASEAQKLCDNLCPQACCLSADTCVDVAPDVCINFHSGLPQGPGTDCNSVECPACGDNCYYAADFDGNCYITMHDLTTIRDNWSRCDCGPTNDWCDGADMNQSHCVTLIDFAIFSAQWPACTDPYGDHCDNVCI